MYIKMSETFIKIDSLQHLEISRQTYPTYRSKIRANYWWKFYGDRTRKKKLLRAIEKYRYLMASEKLYRNTLKLASEKLYRNTLKW